MNELPAPRSQDPWSAVGRITGGVIVYGLVGYGLDRWLGTSFIVGLGIVFGAALGIYTILATSPRHDRGEG